MGIEKPYEVETHHLGAPPAPHAPFDLRTHMEALIAPVQGGVVVAGRHLRVASDEEPDQAARALRETLIRRFRERRPDADAQTWWSFASQAHGMVREGEPLEGVRRSLLEAVDGL